MKHQPAYYICTTLHLSLVMILKQVWVFLDILDPLMFYTDRENCMKEWKLNGIMVLGGHIWFFNPTLHLLTEWL